MEVKNIRISNCMMNDNSRMDIKSKDVASLMASINEQGLLQPIGVRKVGSSLQICYGNRRLEAFKKLGHKTIPAVVLENGTTDIDVHVKNLTENVQRAELSLLEFGRYIEKLTKMDMSFAEIAVKIGMKTSFVKSCKTAFDSVPEDYKAKIVVTSIGKPRKPGQISLSVVKKLINCSKRYGLSVSQKKKLFHVAACTGFDISKVNEYASQILNNAIKKPADILSEVNEKYVSKSVSFKFKRDEYDKLKAYAVDQGYGNASNYIKAVFAGDEEANFELA